MRTDEEPKHSIEYCNSDRKYEIDKMLGLLDFYSGRGVAHASFFIASVFGLIAFSSITSDAFRSNTLFYFPAFILFFGLAYIESSCSVN